MAQRKAEWQNKYIAKTYDRVNLTLPKGKKAELQAHATAKKESLNGFINRAIDETVERDSNPSDELAQGTEQSSEPKQPASTTINEEVTTPLQQLATSIPTFNVDSLYTEMKRKFKIDSKSMNFDGKTLSCFQIKGIELTPEQCELTYDGMKLLEALTLNKREEEVTIEWLEQFVIKV